MAATATALSGLLQTKADINFYTLQSMYWNNKYEANSAKLQKQVQAEEKWNNSYDSCFYAEEGKEVKIGNQKYAAGCECQAKEYADQKVRQYDAALSEELAELDMEYDTMKCMYDTLLEELRAKEDSQKTLTSEAAQDTGLLNAG